MIQIVSFLWDTNYPALVNKVNIDLSAKNANNYKCIKIDYDLIASEDTVIAFILYEKIIYTKDEK